jgi:hypothetical protein
LGRAVLERVLWITLSMYLMRELGWFAAAAAIKPNMFLSTLVLQDNRED